MEASVGHCTNQVSPLFPCHQLTQITTKERQMVSWKGILQKKGRGGGGEEFLTSTRSYKKTYMWTSLSPLLFVICHVSPLLGSRPGCEISNLCFLTSWMNLQCYERWKMLKENNNKRTISKQNQIKYILSRIDLTFQHWNAQLQDLHPKWKCNHKLLRYQDAKISLHTTFKQVEQRWQKVRKPYEESI